MNRISKISLTILCLCIFQVAYSQENRDRKDKFEDRIESMRVAYLTDKLALTPEEAQRFWPVYNELREKLEDRRSRERLPENLTEAEAEALLSNYFSHAELEIALKKEYYQKLKAIIPTTKIIRLEEAERNFKHEVLQDLRKNIEKRKRRD